MLHFIFILWKIFKTYLTCILVFQIVLIERLKSKLNMGISSCIYECISGYLTLVTQLVIQHLLSFSPSGGPPLKELTASGEGQCRKPCEPLGVGLLTKWKSSHLPELGGEEWAWGLENRRRLPSSLKNPYTQAYVKHRSSFL